MSLRNLIRVGRRWINPWFVVEIEDATRPSPVADPDKGHFVLTVVPGRSMAITGDDARELRRLLGESEPDDAAQPAVGAPPPEPPGDEDDDVPNSHAREPLAGHGPMPLVRSADPLETRRVAE